MNHSIKFKDNNILFLEDNKYEFTSRFSIFMENCICVSLQKDTMTVSVPHEANSVLSTFVHSVLDTISSFHNLKSKHNLKTEIDLFFKPSSIILKSIIGENLLTFKNYTFFKNKSFNATIEWKKIQCIVQEEYIIIIPHFELIEMEFTSVINTLHTITEPIINTTIQEKLIGNVAVYMRLDVNCKDCL